MSNRDNDKQASPLRIEYLLCGLGIGFTLGITIIIIASLVGVK